MGAIYLLVPTLVTIVISMLIVRAGAIALMMTGMNFDKAKFQALSAFSGTGFTTREAERVVHNPQRRKIVSWLMVLGNAGIVTVIVTATSSFAQARGFEIGLNLLILLAGAILIFYIARSLPLASRWEAFIEAKLKQTKLFEEDASIEEMLHITEGYGVARILLMEKSTLIGKTITEINKDLENSFILGIEHKGTWRPKPKSSGELELNDVLVIYGKLDELSHYFG